MKIYPLGWHIRAGIRGLARWWADETRQPHSSRSCHTITHAQNSERLRLL